MLSALTPLNAISRRELMLWAGLGTLVLAQVVVLWMLCTQQVRKAELREAGIRVHRHALADCLHHATLATCVSRLERDRQDGTYAASTAGAGDMNSAAPAAFVFR